jgi:hypothetical protein
MRSSPEPTVIGVAELYRTAIVVFPARVTRRLPGPGGKANGWARTMHCEALGMTAYTVNGSAGSTVALE